MKRRSAIRMVLWATLSSCFCAEWAIAQKVPTVARFPLMDQAAEIQMALSAAPEYLRQRAGAYVLSGEGFKKVRESENGFNCLVERHGVNGKAPVCYDQEGSATTLETRLLYMLLLQRGQDEHEVERQMMPTIVRVGCGHRERLESPTCSLPNLLIKTRKPVRSVFCTLLT
jgi:hypothetical protein